MRHSNSLDLLRLIAASAVIYGHSWPILGFRDPELFGIGIDGLGVMVFFAISGYLITKSWSADPNLSRFWAKRALRILPALAVMILSIVFVVGPLLSTLSARDYFTSGTTWRYALLNLVLWTTHRLPGVFESNHLQSVNNSLWTLPMEVTMYAATLVMVPLLVRYPRLMIGALTGIAFAGTALFLRHPWMLRPITDMTLYSYRFYDLCAYMPSYLIGVLFAFVGADRLSRRAKIAAVAVSIAALVYVQVLPSILNLPIALVPIVVLTLVVGLSGRLRLPLLARVGDISYGTYLWGFFVQQVVVQAVDGAITPLALAAVSMPVSWVLGALSWRLVEQPALHWKPRTAPRLAPQAIEVGADVRTG